MELYEAFALEPGSIVSLVGATGNTRLAYGLAREAAARGLSAVVTSTAGLPMEGSDGLPVIQSPPEAICERLVRELQPGRGLVAVPASDRAGHWAAYPQEVVDAIAAAVRPDLLVVKCDGGRGRPFKAPAIHEPPIPASATNVIVGVGLDILGRPMTDEHVHRHERVRAIAACQEGDIVTADMVVAVLTHPEGGRKNVPAQTRLSALLDGPSTSEHERLGSYIAGRLVYAGFHRAVVATTAPWCEVRAVVR